MTTNVQQTQTTESRPVREAAEKLAEDSAELVERAKAATAEKVKKPTTAATIAGAVVVGAAATFGVIETALGGLAAYVTYKVLRKRKTEVAAAES
jgi:hypothetical protein